MTTLRTTISRILSKLGPMWPFWKLFRCEKYFQSQPAHMGVGLHPIFQLSAQNPTIFRPYLGCETHIKGRDNPKFWYFSSLTKLWKWPEFEKNPQFRSWGWFYTVSWNIGCGPTPIWAGWDWKYFSRLNNFQKGLMGPSFGKIPEMVVLMR